MASLFSWNSLQILIIILKNVEKCCIIKSLVYIGGIL